MEKVVKRSGEIADFDDSKIKNAVMKACEEVYPGGKGNNDIAELAREKVNSRLSGFGKDITSMSVEDIQDIVEQVLMSMDGALAKAYITYRYKRAIARGLKSTDAGIMSLIESANEEIKQENSNKNPTLLPTQRDYMAGEVSKDITKRILLPPDVVEADEEGLIHFHDPDYYIQHMHNCDLVNLEDMLQNGTVISGTKIEKPHSFSTACTITTQIIAQVASNQYGGQSISLAHLAPFVQVSRERIYGEVKDEYASLMGRVTESDKARIDEIVSKRLRKEIERGVQTIQYQIVTLMTTNGQSPFVTVFMYLGEAKEEQTRSDLALIIEEVLKQRYQGVKNEAGVWITPAFPKLIYVLEESNIHKESPYYYLTELAAKCTAKRMVPDYISEKVMKRLKAGNCFPVMG